VHFRDDQGRNAESADRFLSARGLILRRMEAYGIPQALRLSVGSEEANRAVVEALAAFRRKPS
jgi:histidinol-phosphate aminotransferase